MYGTRQKYDTLGGDKSGRIYFHPITKRNGNNCGGGVGPWRAVQLTRTAGKALGDHRPKLTENFRYIISSPVVTIGEIRKAE
ncbi:hypothetical protein J6590_057665 [Homalodisca vitripennis]|nr:hypothetical protein J6590_057665 [Homalodisca vitripennis]